MNSYVARFKITVLNFYPLISRGGLPYSLTPTCFHIYLTHDYHPIHFFLPSVLFECNLENIIQYMSIWYLMCLSSFDGHFAGEGFDLTCINELSPFL